jgi:hypothetical protein
VGQIFLTLFDRLKKVFNLDENTFERYDKVFGRSLNEENVVHGNLFLDLKNSKLK